MVQVKDWLVLALAFGLAMAGPETHDEPALAGRLGGNVGLHRVTWALRVVTRKVRAVRGPH